MKKITEATLDDLWARLVKYRAGEKCEVCGSVRFLNSHHIFSRSNRSTRWDVENGVCLCASHHMLNSNFSAHKTPLEFADWVRERRGDAWYRALRRRKNRVYKPDNQKVKAYLDKIFLEL